MKRTFKALLIIVTLAAAIAAAGQARSAKLEGIWFSVSNAPDGTPLQMMLAVQKQPSGWDATLSIGGGIPVPLQNIRVSGNTLSFTLGMQPGAPPATAALNAKRITGAEELEGYVTLGRTKVSLKFTRNQPQPPEETVEPNELAAMIASISGPLSDRPFVPPVTHAAIQYGIRPPHDPVAELRTGIESGKVRLKFDGEDGYLHSLLDALNVPVESQMSIFSKTSVQGQIIGPDNPRKLYFNDTVVVGYVGGGFIEIAAQDPEQGMSFYVLQQVPAEKPFLVKNDRCLQCHLSRNSMDIPGMVLRSVYPAPNGDPVNPLGSHLRDHRTPFEERFGGWYVTGNTGAMKHLGNSVFADTGEARPLAGHYPSDIAAIMVFDHQMHMMNLITRAGWDFRIASYLRTTLGKRNETIDRQLHDEVNDFVDYLLFVDEAPLKDKVQSASGFPDKFAAAGPADSKGRSLRQLDLEHRLMRYPCSYMIYSPAFDALPAEAKSMIYARIPEVLNAKVSNADRQAVIEILRDTKKDFAAQLR